MAAEHKAFSTPDDVRELPLGEAEVLQIGGGEVGRYTLQPGWRWTTRLKEQVGTELRRAPHFQFHAAGRLGVREADGSELEIGPGEVSMLPPATTPG